MKSRHVKRNLDAVAWAVCMAAAGAFPMDDQRKVTWVCWPAVNRFVPPYALYRGKRRGNGWKRENN